MQHHAKKVHRGTTSKEGEFAIIHYYPGVDKLFNLLNHTSTSPLYELMWEMQTKQVKGDAGLEHF